VLCKSADGDEGLDVTAPRLKGTEPILAVGIASRLRDDRNTSSGAKEFNRVADRKVTCETYCEKE
jgi:hypothetical protein